MASDFRLFGPAHLTILAAVPAAGATLAALARRSKTAARRMRFAAAIFLAVNEIAWWIWRYSTEGNRFPEGLPLQLCDLSIWLTVVCLLTLAPWAYDVAYFAGLAGAAMAVLTPDLWAPLCSYPSIYFFVAHGGAVAAILALAWSRLARPRSMLPALLVLNAYALAVGVFNALFGANYMYLCRKPPSASLLDWFGPWPWYLVAGDAVAAALFWLMWIPYRRKSVVGSR